jgi:diguanylate cyclase (GGDEF)-like protein
MGPTPDKDQVLGDYAIFIKALLPQVAGLLCHDREGRVIWRDLGERSTALPKNYESLLHSLLKAPGKAASAGRLNMDDAAIYIAPLLGHRDQVLGALTVIVDPSAGDMPYEFCLELLQPAVRSLQRELTLRFRLLDGYRKLNVQSAEESLLHKVERLVHQRRPCEKTLTSILRLCRKYLQVEVAALVIPDRRVRIIEGGSKTAVEAGLWIDDMLEESTAQTSLADSGIRIFQDGEMLSLPVCQENAQPVGILALSGWARSEFSLRRRRRVARYVVSHVEYVLDRDFDALTGLLSWSLFEAQVIEACKDGATEDHVVMYLDVDQLHVINDTFGREAGDEILAAFAALLRDRLDGHMVTRITSDSFAALLVDTDIERARACGEDLCRRFRELEYVSAGKTYRPSVSIGVGPLSGTPQTASGALATAQVACQAAKDRGRGRVELYQPEDVSIVQRFDDIQLVGYIRNAVESDRLVLLGQPIVSVKTGDAAHYYEVLVRLLDDDGQHVPPAVFLSAAERYQLMEEIDRWVISRALKMIGETPACCGPDASARFALNLSGQSMGNEGFLTFVQDEIQKCGVAPELLCFEITETVAVANMQRAQHFMRTLKGMGCRFSLDDFGTGLSSFAYLKLFPVDTLKIDGSFVRDIATNEVSQSVVAAISEVARVMGLETVAEYVQDEPAMELLRDLGVTWAQGYLLGTPELLEEKLSIIDMAPTQMFSATFTSFN